MLLPLMFKGKLKYCTDHTRDFVHVNDVVDCIKMFLRMDNFDDLDELIYQWESQEKEEKYLIL